MCKSIAWQAEDLTFPVSLYMPNSHHVDSATPPRISEFKDAYKDLTKFQNQVELTHDKLKQ